MKYISLKRFMELNHFTDENKAKKLFDQIKKNSSEGKCFSLIDLMNRNNNK